MIAITTAGRLDGSKPVASDFNVHVVADVPGSSCRPGIVRS
jgi:hypothetical protein